MYRGIYTFYLEETVSLTEGYSDFALCTQVVLSSESELGADSCLVLRLLRGNKVSARSGDLLHALSVAAEPAVYNRQFNSTLYLPFDIYMH